MALPKRYCPEVSPEGTVRVNHAELCELIRQSRLIENRAKHGSPVWSLCLKVRHLGDEWRSEQWGKFEKWLEAFFGPETAAEQSVVNSLFRRALWGSGVWGQYIENVPDRVFLKELADARAAFTNKLWIDECLAPVQMPVFIAMCKRRFGAAVARRMTAINKARASKSKVKKAKKKIKEAKVAETVSELRKHACFNQEGGIVSRN